MAASRRSGRVALAALLAAFVLAAAAYEAIVPWAEHPDEPFHMSYVVWLGNRWTLPDVRAEDKPFREAHQPPLYYAVAALAWDLVGGNAPEEPALEAATLLPRNPDFGDPSGTQNNRFLHTDAEAFPFQGWVLSVHLLRLVLLPIAVGVVAVTYALARLIRPASPRFALFAASVVAFLPQFLFLSGSITNDLLPALCAGGVLWLLVRGLRDGTLGWPPCLLVGLLVALGTLAKDTMLTMLPAVGIGLLFVARGPVDLLRLTALVGLPFAVLLGPLFVRNALLYGNPLLASTAQQLVVPYLVHEPRSPFSWYFVETAPILWGSFVANFGWMSLPLGRLRLPYDLFGLGAAAGTVVFAVAAIRGRVSSFEARAALVLWAAVGGSLAGYVYHNLTIDSHQGRHLYTALPAFGVLVALGYAALLGRLRLASSTRRYALRAFLVVAPLYALAAGFYMLWPVFGHILVP